MEDLVSSTSEFLRELLVESQSSTRHALSTTNPEGWMDIASSLMRGVSPTSLRKDKGGKYGYPVIMRVKSELEAATGYPELKKSWALEAATNINLNRLALTKASGKLLDQIEEEDYKVTPKDLKELAATIALESTAHQRLIGEADVTVKVNHATIEDVMSLAKEAEKRIKEAEVIDID